MTRSKIATRVALAIAAAEVVLFLIYWKLDPDPDKFDEQIAFIQISAQIVAGIAGAYALYLGYQRLEVARDSQITDRFTKSIEQLGNKESLAIRLGGIYALERIARESKRDHWPIMETLTAYVREHSPRRDSDRTPIATDIQAILTVIGRRNTDFDEPSQRLNLVRVNLCGAYLPRSNLFKADLTEADLRDAVLIKAILTNSYLVKAILDHARVASADLSGASLQGANLTSTALVKANLAGAHLSGAKLGHAFLCDADLSGANLTGSIVDGADFTNANLSGANLTGIDFSSANVVGANILGAKVDGTKGLIPGIMVNSSVTG